uniref:Uncharacterized protein n=1 Tax=Arundo donax TaxID=35708 RepID=A0A0A8YGZ3_ARUDO
MSAKTTMETSALAYLGRRLCTSQST